MTPGRGGAMARVFLFLVAALAVASAGCDGRRSGEAAFVVLLGADTGVVERFRRTTDSLTGDIVVRAPGSGATQRLRYEAGLRAGRIEEIVVTAEEGGGTERLRVRLGADSAGGFALVTQGDQTVPVRLPADSGTVPLLSVSIAMLEQVAARVGTGSSTTARVPLLMLDGMRPTTAIARRVAQDSVLLATDTEQFTVRIDLDGRIQGGGDALRGIAFERVAEPPRGWFER